jgi:hypothetical protein
VARLHQIAFIDAHEQGSGEEFEQISGPSRYRSSLRHFFGFRSRHTRINNAFIFYCRNGIFACIKFHYGKIYECVIIGHDD